jgi:hypothetical protein
MGADDPVMEVPWSSPDRSLHYVNLHLEPERIAEIEEARNFAELADFLRRINADGTFETVKCDVWSSTEIEPAEEIFGGKHKHGSYCDLVFRDPSRRESFEQHEALMRRLVELLSKAPEIPASVEFVLRSCVFHEPEITGCAITCFVTAFGADAPHARQQWAIALGLVESVLRQIAPKNH